MLYASPALILLVDDDPTHLRLLSKALSDKPWAIAVATGGEIALQMVQQETPYLIIVDAQMPGMDGFELCERIWADPAMREIPLIFMTALHDTSVRMRGFNLGAVDFVTKQFEQQELVARVTTHLSLRSAMKALSERNTVLAREIDERKAAQAELSRVVHELERVQEELRRGRDALEVEVARRTEELRQAKERVESELAERQRVESERASLQEQVIAAQAAKLMDLSMPIIPISDKILVMPLVGAVDQGRAERILEAALQRATERQAEVIILDITGVPHADERVATATLRTARALRLIGAQTILTGIRPDVARTLVGLDVDFSDIVTRGTLQAGIAYAMTSQRG